MHTTRLIAHGGKFVESDNNVPTNLTLADMKNNTEGGRDST